jgi:hypothetical protein
MLFSVFLILPLSSCSYLERAAAKNDVSLGWTIRVSEPSGAAKNIVLLLPYPYFKGKPWLKVKDYLYKNMRYQYDFDPFSKEGKEASKKWQKATPKDIKLSQVENEYGTFLKVEIPDLLSKERMQKKKAGRNGIRFYTKWIIKPAKFVPSKKTKSGKWIRVSKKEWPYLCPTFESKEEAMRTVEQAINYTTWQRPGNISLVYVSYEGAPITFRYDFSVHYEEWLGLLPLPGVEEGINLIPIEKQLKSGSWYVVSVSGEYNL